MRTQLFLLFATILFASCSPKVYRTYEKDSDEAPDCGLVMVRVHPPDSVAEQVGEILIDDPGASVDCSEWKTINYIKNEACKLGAEIVLIKNIERPDFKSYCYRCTGVLYKYKAGAKPIKPSKYYDKTRIKKREQRDRAKQMGRTVGILGTVYHIVHLFTGFGHHHDHK